jgi:hypothetical protein
LLLRNRIQLLFRRLRHPEDVTNHAAKVWLTVGGDRKKGLQLTARNLAIRQAALAYALHQGSSRRH